MLEAPVMLVSRFGLRGGSQAMRMAVTSVYALLLASVLWIAANATTLQPYSSWNGMMWSSRPMTPAELKVGDSGVFDGSWSTVIDTSVVFELKDSRAIFLSYYMVVTANVREPKPGSPFLQSPVNLVGRERIQVRLSVDGIPFRESASSASPASPYAIYTTTLDGNLLIPNLGPGNHTVLLQWKATGGERGSGDRWVLSWSNIPSAEDGFMAGRAIVVTAQHNYAWSRVGELEARISHLGVWKDVPDLYLNLSLPEPCMLRILYHVGVQIELQEADAALAASPSSLSSLSCRVVVDGVPFMESLSTSAVGSREVPLLGSLQKDVVLNLTAGQHDINVQWRMYGSLVKAWRSSPSLLDGFISSRSLSIMGHRFDIAQEHILTPVVLPDTSIAGSNEPEWQTVTGASLSFYLHSEAQVLLSYSLPVTQHGHPLFDSWTWERWNSISTRLLVDGTPHHHSAGSEDGAVRIAFDLRGQLLLALAPGTHTAALQWKTSDDWMTLNLGQGEGPLGAGGLLLLVNTENNVPTITLPDLTGSLIWEDVPFVIRGISVADIDEEFQGNYLIEVTIRVGNGTLSVDPVSASRLVLASNSDEVGVGDSSNSSFFFSPTSSYFVLRGTIANVNAVIGEMTYLGELDWYGQDFLEVIVHDLMYIGTEVETIAREMIQFDVKPVADLAVIHTPSEALEVEENGLLRLQGFSITDSDALLGVDDFLVVFSVTVGSLEIDANDLAATVFQPQLRRLELSGSLEDINAALQEGLLYRPPTHYNSKLYGELLFVQANQLDSSEPVVSLFLPIVVLSVNDPAEIASPTYHRISLSGFRLKSSSALHSGYNNSSSSLVLSITTERSVVALYDLTANLLDRVTFVAGQPEVLGKSCEVLGTYADIEAILTYGSIVYMNNAIGEQGQGGSGSSTDILYISLYDTSSKFLSHQSVMEISISPSGEVKLPALSEVALLEDTLQEDTAILVLQSDINVLDNSTLSCQISGDDTSLYPVEKVNSTHLQCSVKWEDLIVGIKSFPISNSEESEGGGGFAFISLLDTAIGKWTTAGQVYIPTVPVVKDISPRFGSSCGGTSLNISGGEFQPDANMLCYFSCADSEEQNLGHPAEHIDTAQWISRHSIQCITPGQMTVNCTRLNISLGTSGRVSSALDNVYFEYVPPPFPTVAGPLDGPASGGTMVEIGGKGMSGSAHCMFGRVSVPVEYISPSLIHCVAPPATDATRGLSVLHTITANTHNGQLRVYSGDGWSLLPFVSVVPGEKVWFETADIWNVPRVTAESLAALESFQDPWGQWTTQSIDGADRVVWSVLVPSIDDMNYSPTTLEHFLWLNLNGTDFGPLPIVITRKNEAEFVPLTIVTAESENCMMIEPDIPMAFIFRYS